MEILIYLFLFGAAITIFAGALGPFLVPILAAGSILLGLASAAATAVVVILGAIIAGGYFLFKG